MATFNFYSESETGTPTSLPLGAVFFDYEAEAIKALLARSNEFETARGIKFHFNRPLPENPSALYAVACGITDEILDPDTVAKDDYFKNDGGRVAYSRLPTIIRSAYEEVTCVYFSRDLLNTYLSNPQVAGIRFYVVGFGEMSAGVGPYLTLVSVGIDREGRTLGDFLRSEKPCPPNCPSGPGGYDTFSRE